MELRVEEREWIQFQFPYLMAFLGGEKRVAEMAYATGAFVRRREIESPGEMLQLLLTWAVAERSLQETAALAAEAGMADDRQTDDRNNRSDDELKQDVGYAP